MFLVVVETIVGLLVCCDVGIVHSLFSLGVLRHLVIAPARNIKKLIRKLAKGKNWYSGRSRQS